MTDFFHSSVNLFDPARPIFPYNCSGHNHAVQLAGWGTDDATGERFWTLRNRLVESLIGSIYSERERGGSGELVFGAKTPRPLPVNPPAHPYCFHQ